MLFIEFISLRSAGAVPFFLVSLAASGFTSRCYRRPAEAAVAELSNGKRFKSRDADADADVFGVRPSGRRRVSDAPSLLHRRFDRRWRRPLEIFVSSADGINHAGTGAAAQRMADGRAKASLASVSG